MPRSPANSVLRPLWSRWAKRRRVLAAAPAGGPPPPAGDFIITGTLSPDATGTYDAAGTYNTKPYYQRSTDSFYIYWHADEAIWILAPTLEPDPGAFWRRTTPNPDNPAGTYDVQTGAVTGTAIVAAP